MDDSASRDAPVPSARCWTPWAASPGRSRHRDTVTGDADNRACGPALLADVAPPLAALAELDRGPERDAAATVRLRLRRAELLLRFVPADALALLDELPAGAAGEGVGLDPAAVRAAALVELDRLDQARPLVARLPEGGTPP